jgi:hypothetical protein
MMDDVVYDIKYELTRIADALEVIGKILGDNKNG